MGWLDSLGSWASDFGSGLVSGLAKPETILGTVGLFAQSSAQKNASENALNASREAAQQKFENDVAILNLKHQQDLEMMRAGGGGGGGGGSAASLALANAELALKRRELAQQKALAKFEAMQTAKKMQLDSTQSAGELKQRALENLMQGATAPLGR